MKKCTAIIAVITVCIFIAGCADLQRVAAQSKPLSEPVPCFYEVLQAEQGDFEANEFDAKMDSTIRVLRNRLDEKGSAGAAVFQQGANRIRIEIPMSTDSQAEGPDAIIKAIISQGLLEFKNAAGETKLTGAVVDLAYPSQYTDQTTGVTEYVVSLRFNAEGVQLFGDLTKDAWDNNTDITITLDGQTISTAGVNNGPIYGGEAQIEGSFTVEEAKNLAMQIESGALPLQLRSIDSGTGISENPQSDDNI